MYSGDKCQTESNEVKAVKSTVRFTSILAVLILIGFYLMFILIDLWNLYESRKRGSSLKINKKTPRVLVYKFAYKN
jgi:hypothetical protein